MTIEAGRQSRLGVLQIVANLDVGGAQAVVRTLACRPPRRGSRDIDRGAARRTVASGDRANRGAARHRCRANPLGPLARIAPRAVADPAGPRRHCSPRANRDHPVPDLLQALDFLVLTLKAEPTVRKVYITVHNARFELRRDQLPSHLCGCCRSSEPRTGWPTRSQAGWQMDSLRSRPMRPRRPASMAAASRQARGRPERRGPCRYRPPMAGGAPSRPRHLGGCAGAHRRRQADRTEGSRRPATGVAGESCDAFPPPQVRALFCGRGSTSAGPSQPWSKTWASARAFNSWGSSRRARAPWRERHVRRRRPLGRSPDGPAWQAMAMRIPVVASDVSGQP